MKQWRRGFAVTPPELTKDDERYPGHDPRYAKLSEKELPLTESLALTIDRVIPYWNETILHTMHGNWTLQYGFAKPSEQSFKFEEGTDAAFHGFWLWPCTMLNVTPIKGMMTVIYEFPVDS